MDSTLLVGDIVERVSHEKQKSPAHVFDFSDVPSASAGFPLHKKRGKTSSFKQRRAEREAGGTGKEPLQDESYAQGRPGPSRTQSQAAPLSFDEMEKRRIDQENRQKIDSMSPSEIARAQEEILNGLDPALVQRLLQRANIEEDVGSLPFEEPAQHSSPPRSRPEGKAKDNPPPDRLASQGPGAKEEHVGFDGEAPRAKIPPDLLPVSDAPQRTHFPAPPRSPEIDPSDPDFLAHLHEKYFPHLPADPSKLAWMAPLPTEDSPADKESPYYPHPQIPVSALRFDFRGRFVPPRLSRTIASTKGLHHHGQAPEAAGYTVAELARLARSAVPAQRCMAFQTLGRILYRLGRGDWGQTEDDPIAAGVWTAVKEGKVLETLAEAAIVESGHRSSQVYATEALWLFEKGGWKERFTGR